MADLRIGGYIIEYDYTSKMWLIHDCIRNVVVDMNERFCSAVYYLENFL